MPDPGVVLPTVPGVPSRIAIATFVGITDQFDDDERLAEALRGRGSEADLIAWDALGVDWSAFDAVVIRSTWDYTDRPEEFLAWVEGVGDRLHNSPALVRWNSDKRYLQDLEAAGIAVVPTTYVAPGEPLPALEGEVVIKPSVSAGAKDSGRFGSAAHDQARALIERIHRAGRTAMVQPYLASVDTRGETAIVCLDGTPSHALHKGAVLRPDEVAPLRGDGLGVAEVMYDPNLVVAGTADEAELALARAVLDAVTARFSYVPLYARVDMVEGSGGAPVLMELEAIEPSLYLDQVPGAVDLVADAILARLGAEA